MRDLFRLVVVALMSFAVVGVAMVYSRGGDLDGAFRAVSTNVAGFVGTASERVGLVPETSTQTEAAPVQHSLTLPRPNPAQWVGLAGLPDQAEISFALPRGAVFVSGALDLVLDTQLAEGGDGLLTLSVNGTPRGQVVLNSGNAQHQVRIALSAADLLGDRVVLHMAGRGNTGSGQICPNDAANAGSAVTLATESALELQSDHPLRDAVAALVLAPQPLVLQPGSNPGDMALAIWASQHFNRAGIAARIGQAGSGETEVAIAQDAVLVAGLSEGNRLAGRSAVDQVIAAAGSAMPQPVGWPVSVADLGAETLVKSFRGSRRWVVGFNPADLPDGALPEQFQLRLKTTPLAGSSDWVVRVSLNGNLVETRRLAGSTDTIAFDIALPPERMLPSNSIVIELVDTTPNEGICARGPDAQAQLQPESGLVNTASLDTGWAGLVEALAAAPEIGLEADPDLSAAQAGQASIALSSLLPRRAALRLDGKGDIRLSVTSRQGLASWLTGLDPTTPIAALLPNSTGGSAPVLVPVPGMALSAGLERLGQDDAIILVTGR